MTDPAISAAAQSVAVCVAQHQRASEGLAQAEAARGIVAERLFALDGDRAAIIGRRRAGDIQPDDAGMMALIEADREGLSSMLADADAVVAAAQIPVQEAGHSLAIGRRNLQQAEDEVTEAALLEHVGKLDALMLETVTQIGALGVRLGRGRPLWSPSRPLAEALRRLQSMRGEL